MIGCFAAVSEAKLTELRADPDAVADFLFTEAEDGGPAEALDIDKTWHGLHFLLTGESYGGEGPLAWAIMGGEPIGEDVGYGPARYLEPQQVREVAAALAPITVQALNARYDPAAFEKADIYPTGIWRSEGQGAFDYLAEWYEDLVAFYARAAERGDAVLLYVA
ncbi:YfbM family protein [Aquabacterium sp. A7-Y]|uniref:YfbM family protein n=1 Tax=Aquabacterium sp. A7-Y TaxID=1349605 RepID=UPI00223D3803|nr:YfbM family protein [Aquabacterium sp. A7-Y]MCW7537951.1 YfbM family protein [Aquabacterium sp. A7-Y]